MAFQREKQRISASEVLQAFAGGEDIRLDDAPRRQRRVADRHVPLVVASDHNAVATVDIDIVGGLIG